MRGGPRQLLSPLPAPGWPPSLGSALATLLELSTYGLLLYWTGRYFSLELRWDKKLLESKVGTCWGALPRAPHLPEGLGGLSLTPRAVPPCSFHLPRVQHVAADGDAAAGGGGLPVPVLGDPGGRVPVGLGGRGGPQGVWGALGMTHWGLGGTGVSSGVSPGVWGALGAPQGV